MNLQRILLISIALFILSSCKGKKESELKDDQWREESQKIASDLCEKFQSCANSIMEKVKPSLRKYAESEIRSDKCTEKNKRSRVYLLKGYDPKFIQEKVRDCYAKSMALSCEKIQQDAIMQIESCVIMKKIQQGEKI